MDKLLILGLECFQKGLFWNISWWLVQKQFELAGVCLSENKLLDRILLDCKFKVLKVIALRTFNMYEPPALPTAEKMTGIKAMVSKLWLIERLGHWNFWLKRFFSPFKQLELNIQTYPPSCTILNFVSSPVAAKLASSNAAPLLSFILPVLALFITLSMSLICTRCVSIRSPTCKMGFLISVLTTS